MLEAVTKPLRPYTRHAGDTHDPESLLQCLISHLFFYQLALLGLLWLCCMLHYAWPSDHAADLQRLPQPLPPPRKPPRVSKPFPGLTHKPHCDACEPATASRPQAPCAPPPPIVSTRGRRHQVNTSRHFCPDSACRYGGWLGLGNISANGHPSGGPWRQLHCTSCGGYFQETHGTPLHGKRVGKRNRSMCDRSVAERCSCQSGSRQSGDRWDTSHPPH